MNSWGQISKEQFVNRTLHLSKGAMSKESTEKIHDTTPLKVLGDIWGLDDKDFFYTVYIMSYKLKEKKNDPDHSY